MDVHTHREISWKEIMKETGNPELMRQILVVY